MLRALGRLVAGLGAKPWRGAPTAPAGVALRAGDSRVTVTFTNNPSIQKVTYYEVEVLL